MISSRSMRTLLFSTKVEPGSPVTSSNVPLARLMTGELVSSAEPVAITLRYLQTLTEIASEKNSTIIFPLPMELLNLIGSRKE